MRAIRLILATLLALLACAAPTRASSPWTETAADGSEQVRLYLFWSARCPHCLEARPHILPLPARYPWLRLLDLELTRHPENARLYVAMAESLGQEARSVPAFLFCGEMHVGWDSAETTLPFLLERMEACRQRLAKGEPAVAGAPPAPLELPLIGRLDADRFSLPLLTVVIAGMDAFNPCAFFVLLFLLSLMAHQPRRGRMLLVGGIFVFFSGLMYFAFMAAWLNLFRVLGNLAWVTLAAGGLALLMGLVNVKDFFAFKQGVSLSIPEGRKSDIYRRGRAILSAENLPAMLAATVFLAVAANFYELLCTAGFPMVYTRLLTLHQLPPAGYYLYLALYNVVYVLPLLAIVFAFARTMGARKLTEREGRLLKLLSGLMMLELGLLLLVVPERLSNLGIAFALLAVALAVTYLAARLTRGGGGGPG